MRLSTSECYNRGIIRGKKISYFLVLFVVLGALSPSIIFAWNGVPFSPGATLNPDCLPTDPNCDVMPYSAVSPISYASSTGVFSILQASSTSNGFLSSSDWNLFNNKQNSLGNLLGLVIGDGAGNYSTTTNNSANWNTAYSWGNHASAGYLTAVSASSTYAKLAGAIFSGNISAPNFSGTLSGTSTGTNTGDETQATIKTKLGVASAGVDGYLAGSDWNIFNGKQNTIATGTGSQYLRGDLSLGTFPTLISQFTNDLGFTSSTSVANNYPTFGYASSTYYLASNPSNYITLSNLSSSATGLTYTPGTGAFSLTPNYIIPLSASTTNWNNTYNTVNASSSNWNSAYNTVTASSSFWNTAYSWGSHAAAGYLTSITASSTYAKLAGAIFTGNISALNFSGSSSGANTGDQNITLSGDISGSGTTSISTILPNVNANVGTFQGITVNAKGLITGATNQNYITSAGAPVQTVFGRAGSVIATSGDYNTSQVTENTNLYFTNARAVTALTGQNISLFTNNANYITSAGAPVQTVFGRSGAITAQSGDYSSFYPTYSYASSTYYLASNPSNYIALTNLSSSATGLTYTSGTGAFSLTSGYNIPLTASTTAWNNFYNTPSTQITPGSNLSWSGNTLNGPTDAYIRGLHSAGTGISYASGTGVITNSGVTSLTGTANQVSVSNATGTVTLSLPQNIHTGATPTFAGINLGTLSGLLFGTNGSISTTSTSTLGLLTTNVAEGTNQYFTNARAIASTLTGYASSAGVVAATDSVLGAIQKLNGNITNLVTGVSTVFGRSGAITAQSGDYNTSQVTENTNLYFTNARADARIAVATSTVQNFFSSSATGLTYSGGAFSLTSGYNIPLTASTTAWNNFYNASSTYLTGTKVDSFNTRTGAVTLTSADVTGALTFTPYNATNPSNYIALTNLSSSATGLTYTSGTGVFSLTSGYNIPLTASTTNWNNFYNASSTYYLASNPSNYITNANGLFVNNTTDSTLTRSGTGPYTLGLNLGNANTFTANQTAPKWITTGGTASQFVKGDGTLDSNTYLTGTTGLLATGATTGATSQSQVFTNGVTNSTLTPGSIVFAGTAGVESQNNANLFWDNTNNRLSIGTSTPLDKLQIESGNLRFSVPNAQGNGMQMGKINFFDEYYSPTYARAYISSYRNGGGSNGYLEFGTSPTGNVSPLARMVIDPNGNVGIGSTTPSSLLTVQGNGYFGGNITATGTVVATGNITGASFIKSGGTSAQFLKADGSVDSSTYLTGTKVDSFNTRTGAVTLTSADVTGALTFTPYNATNPSNYIALTNLSSSATGLTYTPGTGAFSLTPNYIIPLSASTTNWNNFYNASSTYYLVSNPSNYITNANGLFVNNTTDSTLTRSGTGPYTLGLNLGNANTFTANQTAPKWITTGGTASQFVKGDGTLDSNTYLTGTTGLLATGATTGATSQSQVFTNGITNSLNTKGSILFAGTSGVESQNNAQLFWDSTNNRLGVGTSTPSQLLTVGNNNQFTVDSSGNTSANGNLFLNPAGSTTAAPRTFGFSPSFNVGQAARLQFGDTNSVIQVAFADRMQASAYWGIELRGNQEASAPAFAGGSSSDASVSIFGTTGNSANILNLNNNAGTALDVVDKSGNFGIGTTTPSRLLDVNGDQTTNLFTDGTRENLIRVHESTFADSAIGSAYFGQNGSGQTVIVNTRPDSGDGIAFFTNSNSTPNTTPRMLINSLGYVGIGTTTPANKLDLWGNLNVGTSSTPLLFANTATGMIGIGTSTSVARLAIVGTSTNDIFNLFDSTGAEKMTMLSSGYVGIGTITPGEKLEVAGAIKVTGTASTNTANSGVYDFLSGSARFVSFGPDSSTKGAFTIGQITSAGSGYTVPFYISPLSNIGIGTTNPQKVLNTFESGVTDSSTIHTGLQINADFGTSPSSQSNAGGRWGITFNGATPGTVSNNKLAGIYAVSEDNLGFNRKVGLSFMTTHGQDTNYSESMRIADGGNVGIGTTTPATTLDVNGTFAARSTSSAVFGNGLTGSIKLGDGTFSKTNGSSYQFDSGINLVSANYDQGFSFNGPSNSTIYGDSSAKLYFTTGGNNKRMTIDATGNVGIGTTAPSANLSIVGTSGSAQNLLSVASSSGQVLSLSNAGVLTTYSNSSGSGKYILQGTNGNQAALFLVGGTEQRMQFGAVNSGVTVGTFGVGANNTTLGSAFETYSSGNLAMLGTNGTVLSTMLNNGNFGIGTASPNLKLELTGAIYVSTSTNSLLNGSVASNQNFTLVGNAAYWGIRDSISHNFMLDVYGGGTPATALSILQANGNVGIGTSTPANKLDIWGNLNVATGTTPAFFVNTAAGNVGVGTSTTAASGKLEVDGAGIFRPQSVTSSADTAPDALMIWDFQAHNNTNGGSIYVRNTNGQQRAVFGYNPSNATFTLGAQSNNLQYLSLNAGGSGNNGAITFNSYYNGGQEIMRLIPSANGGNVGIGTSTPANKLDIWGNLNVSTSSTPLLFANTGNSKIGIGTASPFDQLSNTSSNIQDAVSSGVTGNSSIAWNANAIGYAEGLNQSNSGGNGLLVKILGTATANRILDLNSNGVDRLVFQGNGYLGIGTSTPNGLLTIYGGDRGSSLNLISANNPTLDLNNISAGGHDYQIFSTPVSAGIGAGGFAFYDNTAGRYAFTILANGRMGVNLSTSTLSSMFNVLGSDSTSANSSLNIMNSGYSSLFFVRNDGNVGIGTTSPSQLLTVGNNNQFTVNGTSGRVTSAEHFMGTGVDANYYQDYNDTKGYWFTGAAGINWQNINRVTSNVNVQLQGIAGQTADIFQVASSSGATIFNITNQGSATAAGLTVSHNTAANTYDQFVNANTAYNQGIRLTASNDWYIISAGTLGTTGQLSFLNNTAGVTPMYFLNDGSTWAQQFNQANSYTTLAGGTKNGATFHPVINNSVTDNLGGLRGATYQVEKQGAGNLGATVGLQGAMFAILNNGAGTVTGAAGFNSAIQNIGSGTITNAYGAYFSTPTASLTSPITNSYGLYIDNQGGTGVTNTYGIYQKTSTDQNYFAGKIGIGTTTPASVLDVNGSIRFETINNCASGIQSSAAGVLSCYSSDERIKQNIITLATSSGLDLIDQLNPVTFSYKDPNQAGGVQYGFIAQDVQGILPGLVATSSYITPWTPDGTLTLNYQGLIAPLVEAVKELGNKVKSIMAWFGGDGSKMTIQGDVCVDNVCITKEQFKAMLQNAGTASQTTQTVTPTPTPTSTPTPEPTPVATSTPDVVPDSTPASTSTVAPPEIPPTPPADTSSDVTSTQ